MSSSIFNFENVRRYRRLPARERLWHAAVALAMVATFAGTRELAGRASRKWRVTFISEARKSLTPRTRVVFLGNSHFYSGIRADAFSFDAATISGSGFNYQIIEAALKKNLDRLPGLRIAVIAFDANPLLNVNAVVGASTELDEWGISRADLPAAMTAHAADPRRAFRRYVASPDRLSPATVLNALGLRPRRIVAGHIPSDDRFEPPQGKSKRVALHARAFKESEFAANCASLRRIVRTLDARGVRVILLRTPFHPSYASARPSRWEALCDEALAQVREDPGVRQRVVYLDRMRDGNFRDGDFRDDDHLNSSGAAKFCAWLDGPIATLLAKDEPRARIASGRAPDPAGLDSDAGKRE